MAGYLLDTGVVSSIRNSGLTADDWVGDADLAVTDTIVDELFVDLAPGDIQTAGNLRVLAQLPPPLPDDEQIVRRAEELQARYARHQPPLHAHDALIAAAAITHGRILITRDRKGFHFIRGLRTIDAVDFQPAPAPLTRTRGAVAGEPIARPCCSQIT